MRIRRTAPAAIGVLVAVLLPLASAAQESFPPGQRLRVHAGGHAFVGLVAPSPDGRLRLALKGTGGIRSFELSEIQRVERHRGEVRYVGRTVVAAALTLAVVGGAVMAATWTPCPSDDGPLPCLFRPESRGRALARGMALGAALGAPVGLVVGLNRRYDRWEPVAWPPSPGLSVALRIGS